jgi:hypothetical protein
VRAALAVLLVLSSLAAAHAFGIGKEGFLFGRLGASNRGKPPVIAASCPSPTAPNGAVDLSQCSNAFYVAVIF